MAVVGSLEWGVIILVAFIPAILYLLVIRGMESYHRERIKDLLKVFLLGGTISILIGGTINTLALVGLASVFSLTTSQVMVAVVSAPLGEEMAKGISANSRAFSFFEPEDGLIFGAAAGLGFAAVENLTYFYNAYTISESLALYTIVLRNISTILMHASASALLGYGIFHHVMNMRWDWKVTILPYFIIAVCLHSIFNMIALSAGVRGGELSVILGSTIVNVMFSIALVIMVMACIRKLDKGAPPYRNILRVLAWKG